MVLALAASLLLSAGVARAQEDDPATRARAQALFDQALAEMTRKSFASACPKLEEVVRLQPRGPGARIQLGKCYEGLGRLASAWAMYTKAEAVAVEVHNDARHKEAQEHAQKVRPRLATLTIVVPDVVRATPGIS